LDGAGLWAKYASLEGKSRPPHKVENRRMQVKERKIRELALMEEKRKRERKLGLQVSLALDTQMGLVN